MELQCELKPSIGASHADIELHCAKLPSSHKIKNQHLSLYPKGNDINSEDDKLENISDKKRILLVKTALIIPMTWTNALLNNGEKINPLASIVDGEANYVLPTDKITKRYLLTDIQAEAAYEKMQELQDQARNNELYYEAFTYNCMDFCQTIVSAAGIQENYFDTLDKETKLSLYDSNNELNFAILYGYYKQQGLFFVLNKLAYNWLFEQESTLSNNQLKVRINSSIAPTPISIQASLPGYDNTLTLNEKSIDRDLGYTDKHQPTLRLTIEDHPIEFPIIPNTSRCLTLYPLKSTPISLVIESKYVDFDANDMPIISINLESHLEIPCTETLFFSLFQTNTCPLPSLN